MLGGFVEHQILCRDAVYPDDHVAWQHACARRRRAVDRAHDRQRAASLDKFKPNIADFSSGHRLHGAQSVAVDVPRVRIKRGQHPLDRGAHQLRLVRLIDIVVANLLKDLAKHT